MMLFLHVGSRKVWISPATYHPDSNWVKQQGRNALMWLEDSGLEATHLIHDRDTKFTQAFDQLLQAAGVCIVKSPVQAPNANAFAEARIASVRRECLDHFMCFSLRHVDHIVQAFVDFSNEHRPHQRMGNRILSLQPKLKSHLSKQAESLRRIKRKSQLGGLLKHYYREAA